MKSIFVTGDCHGDLLHLSNVNYKKYQKELKSSNKNENFLIICGDFGFIWDYSKVNFNANKKYPYMEDGVLVCDDVFDKSEFKWENNETEQEKNNLDIINNKPFTTLFVDGNHENFDRLYNDYEVVDFMGGKAHKIRDNIYHMMRGEVFNILGYKFFTFGGAKSHDIIDGIIDGSDPNWQKKSLAMDKCGMYMHRVKGISWWEEELPNKKEMDYGLKNLKKYNNKVDYIITHQPTYRMMGDVAKSVNDFNKFTTYLGKIDNIVEFKEWFCGHMHMDKIFDTKHRILYYDWVNVFLEN